jgi:hypothetical protein
MIISKLKLKLVALETVAHEPLALSKSMKRGELLLLRSAHPAEAGTEARPTNLKLET